MSFPFVRAAIEVETLSIHGLWNDIGEGTLLCYEAETGEWNPVS